MTLKWRRPIAGIYDSIMGKWVKVLKLYSLCNFDNAAFLFAALQGGHAWIPVKIGKDGARYLTKFTAKPRNLRRFPDEHFDPALVKKGPEKIVTEKPWMPKSEKDLRYPPHLFPERKKDLDK